MSRFILHILYNIFILFFVFLLINSPKTVSADGSWGPCTITSTPNQLSQDLRQFTITVESDVIQGATYRWQLWAPGNQGTKTGSNVTFPIPGTNKVEIPVSLGASQTSWVAGTYDFYFADQSKIGEFKNVSICGAHFTIEEKPSQNCTVTLDGYPYFPDTDVLLKITNLEKQRDYDAFVDTIYKKASFTFKEDTTINIGKYAPAEYYKVTILNQCGPFNLACNGKPPQLQCPPVAFSVGPRDSNGGGPVDVGKTIPNPRCTTNCASSGGSPVPGCNDANVPDPNDPSKTIPNPNPGIATAIGCIHTNPAEFVKDLMKFVIGISGGLAFLMMLLGAFQMLTSAGNPETLNAGRDRLTSAVIGLLFVIFAILLLQIIGVDILKIPGFGR